MLFNGMMTKYLYFKKIHNGKKMCMYSYKLLWIWAFFNPLRLGVMTHVMHNFWPDGGNHDIHDDSRHSILNIGGRVNCCFIVIGVKTLSSD